MSLLIVFLLRPNIRSSNQDGHNRHYVSPWDYTKNFFGMEFCRDVNLPNFIIVWSYEGFLCAIVSEGDMVQIEYVSSRWTGSEFWEELVCTKGCARWDWVVTECCRLACANRAHNLTKSKKRAGVAQSSAAVLDGQRQLYSPQKRAGVAQSYSTLDRSKN